MSSYADSASEFGCAGCIFSMKLEGFMSKVIRLLLTELVSQCRNMSPIEFQHGIFCNEVGRIYEQGNKALIN